MTGIQTSPSCGNSNGSVSLMATGGTGSYSYSRDGINYFSTNVFSGLVAGTYNFYVKDGSGCVGSTTVTLVSNDSNISLVATQTSPSCGNGNGSVSLTATGGTGSYSYSRDGINYFSTNVFSGLVAGTYNFYVKDGSGCVGSTTVTLVSNNSSLSLTGIQTSPSCGNSNGSVSLTATGGTGSYSYSRDGINYFSTNVFSGLVAGTYNFYVKDGSGCVGSMTLTLVSNNSSLSLTGIQTSPSCGNSNGSVSLTATGGTGSYSYSRDGVNYFSTNVFSGLVAGTYNFYVKDGSGCVGSTTVTLVSNNSSLSLTGIQTSPSCGNGNGSVSLTATGGTGSYSYSRDGINYFSTNVFSGLVAGTYNFYVKDGSGCVGSMTLTLVSNNSSLSLTGIQTSPSCGNSNGSVSLTATGGTGSYSYSRDGINYFSTNVFSGLVAGTYNFYVKDGSGCVGNTTVTLVSNNSSLSLTGIQTSPSCGNSNGSVSLMATGGTGSYSYSRDGINYFSTNVFSGLVAGTYNFM
ncbi:hyalin domain-containing protein [Emticicia oligotrophica DSM 17448]|uniref:Hyalin domain-containing protein n=1 Tax=Emticicia oligotrophica (strain DSM 17448 / CIP 109782 / MTCC 6937 / GPTSA100-15) TaxID=929562 RepID=A0ABN4ANY2_EMTOG|nr:hyalin domain-containing protein [Emticicia oligotrophica]AFK04155.1 hyalin domain-containing protein [Emticicia oligotrophica DSM 17448]